MSTSLVVEHEVVSSIVEQVWESLLEMSAATTDAAVELGDGPAVQAEITLQGDWNGSVRLSCDAGTAELIARAMLFVGDDEELPEADVHDAIGEIVNMVGGNIKGALGGATALGLPVVRDEPTPAGNEAVVRCVADWHGSPVIIEVFGADRT